MKICLSLFVMGFVICCQSMELSNGEQATKTNESLHDDLNSTSRGITGYLTEDVAPGVVSALHQIKLFLCYLYLNPLVVTRPVLCITWQTLKIFGYPAVVGFSVLLFTWNLVFYNSQMPGVNPPSPLSPQKFRIRSGHSFHLKYVIAVVCGLVSFAVTFWSQITN